MPNRRPAQSMQADNLEQSYTAMVCVDFVSSSERLYQHCSNLECKILRRDDGPSHAWAPSDTREVRLRVVASPDWMVAELLVRLGVELPSAPLVVQNILGKNG